MQIILNKKPYINLTKNVQESNLKDILIDQNIISILIIPLFDKDTFLGFRIDSTTNKVIYISTEDDPSSVSFNIRRQVNRFHYENDALDKSLLKNLENIKKMSLL